MPETLFWILFVIVAYTYWGYAAVIWLLVLGKRIIPGRSSQSPPLPDDLPFVCFFVTAYNEIDFIDQKVENSFNLNYPKEKIQYLWLTDGSNDGTPERLKQFSGLQVEHHPERRGKIHAMNRGMQYVKAPIVIYSDSNTLLAPDTILEMVRQFESKTVGCVAGEKRIVENLQDTAAASGEGFYWKLESFIKRMDAELSSAVGAVGELFAIRTELYEPVEPDTLLDDFIISLRIASKGYRIAYAPKAYAIETASANVKEELKRKTRIAAGGMQTFFRLPDLLNPFRYGWLSFQYFSHKVLRWTLAPFALFLLFLCNLFVVIAHTGWAPLNFYTVFFYLQAFMYFLALIGWLLENHRFQFKFLFIPYYFVIMNYASIRGIIRYLKGQQSVVWEKSKRA